LKKKKIYPKLISFIQKKYFVTSTIQIPDYKTLQIILKVTELFGSQKCICFIPNLLDEGRTIIENQIPMIFLSIYKRGSF